VLCTGLLAGILLRSFVPLSWPFALFLIVGASLALVLFIFDRRHAYTILGIACVALACGQLRMDSARLVHDPVMYEHVGKDVVLIGTIVAEPDVREKNVRLHLQASDMIYHIATTSVGAGVLVVAPLHSEVSYGDVIRAEGRLRLPEAFDTGSGRVFNYPMFLAKDGVLYELAFAEVEVLEEGGGNPVKKAALAIKQQYLRGLQRALPEPAAGLAGGITVGDKRSIGEELSRAFINVSLIHIVVLSGYNMTVVINAAAHAMKYVPGAARSAQFAVSGVIVLFFVLMTGGAPSATRAGAMALIATYARLTGRSFLALRILAVVAAAMALWNPFIVAFDPGFQLSILATAGLILFTPLIAPYLPFISERWGLREIAASTLGTQIAVLPLLLYQNGLLSIAAIPANLLTLVLVPTAMFFSFVASLAGLLFGSFGTLLALPALALLTYIIKVAEILSAIPYAAVTVPAFGVWLMVAMYALLVLVYVWFKKKHAPGRTMRRAV
jgi:competence protein ComEC